VRARGGKNGTRRKQGGIRKTGLPASFFGGSCGKKKAKHRLPIVAGRAAKKTESFAVEKGCWEGWGFTPLAF